MKIPGLSRRTWLAIGLAGALVRLFLWRFTLGTNDVTNWYAYGPSLNAQGIAQTYRDDPLFNHPPLIGLFISQVWWLSGDSVLAFARMIKLLGLLGEAISMWALWRFAGPRAFAVYGWLLAPILITGFHCNSDGMLAALLLVSAIAFDRENYFLAGLLFASACNVKLLPIVLLPLLLLGAPNRRAFLQICAGLAPGILPYLPPALAAGRAMYQDMIVYNSNPDHWGILMLLNLLGVAGSLHQAANSLFEWYRANGRHVVLASIVALALLARLRWSLRMSEQFALGGALFLLLAPGFGVQYVMLIAPLLCLIDLREALLWGWVSGAFIGSVYWIFMVRWWPAHSFFTTLFPYPTWVLGLAAWGVLVLFLWRHLSAAWRREGSKVASVPA